MRATPQGHEAVLDYWFGELTDDWLAEGRQDLWFRSTPEQDREIADRFGETIRAVSEGLYREWMTAPASGLAAVVTLDQFPRNVFRGTAEAFAHDAKALEVALHMIENKFDWRLLPVQRLFLYLPLEHSERMDMQALSVGHFARLAREAPPAREEQAFEHLKYAIAHRDIIARFGRFPHRNDALGRESTPAEKAYLDGGGETFGQKPKGGAK